MRKKVLLADDSATIQKLVDMALSDSDFELLAVSNGKQAIDMLEEFEPDIVFADAIMPLMDGYKVCEFVKKHPRFRNTPVIVLTTRFQPYNHHLAEAVSIDERMMKPFSQEELFGILARFLPTSRRAGKDEKRDLAATAPMPIMAGNDLQGDATVQISPEDLRAHMAAAQKAHGQMNARSGYGQASPNPVDDEAEEPMELTTEDLDDLDFVDSPDEFDELPMTLEESQLATGSLETSDDEVIFEDDDETDEITAFSDEDTAPFAEASESEPEELGEDDLEEVDMTETGDGPNFDMIEPDFPPLSDEADLDQGTSKTLEEEFGAEEPLELDPDLPTAPQSLDRQLTEDEFRLVLEEGGDAPAPDEGDQDEPGTSLDPLETLPFHEPIDTSVFNEVHRESEELEDHEDMDELDVDPLALEETASPFESEAPTEELDEPILEELHGEFSETAETFDPEEDEPEPFGHSGEALEDAFDDEPQETFADNFEDEPEPQPANTLGAIKLGPLTPPPALNEAAPSQGGVTHQTVTNVMLSDEQLGILAEKMVEKLAVKLGAGSLREIVWQVVPELSEAMIKKRIFELEQAVDEE